MCAVCSFGIPLCSIDSSCGSATSQHLKTAALASAPVVGGATVWVQTRLLKRALKKKKK